MKCFVLLLSKTCRAARARPPAPLVLTCRIYVSIQRMYYIMYTYTLTKLLQVLVKVFVINFNNFSFCFYDISP